MLHSLYIIKVFLCKWLCGITPFCAVVASFGAGLYVCFFIYLYLCLAVCFLCRITGILGCVPFHSGGFPLPHLCSFVWFSRGGNQPLTASRKRLHLFCDVSYSPHGGSSALFYLILLAVLFLL